MIIRIILETLKTVTASLFIAMFGIAITLFGAWLQHYKSSKRRSAESEGKE